MKFIVLQIKMFICLLTISMSLYADHSAIALTIEDAKVHYTIELIKHLTWPNENNITHHNIAVLGDDDDLMNAFKAKLVSTSIRGKTIMLEQADSFDDLIKYYSIIYVTEKKLSAVTKIQKKYPKTLIITDGHFHQEHLLAGIETRRNNDISITINRDNLVNKGFKISNSLLEFAGTKEDLSRQLEEQENHLQSLLEISQAKEATVAKLNLKLELLNQSLKEYNDSLQKSQLDLLAKDSALQKSQVQLTALEEKIIIAHDEMTNNQNEIIEQQQIIDQKQREQEQQKSRLEQLRAAIKNSQDKLNKQNTELIQKTAIIDTKEETITDQRWWLYVATAVTFFLLFLKYLVIRLSLVRKKANHQLKEVNEQLFELATTDSMTQLLNRRHFMESAQKKIKQLRETNYQSAALMIDIDSFKDVNDTYGHAMGDEAIIAVANVILENIRDIDIVGRVGGEEFAMFLTKCPLEKAVQIAERVRGKVANSAITFKDNTINLTISIGLTQVKDGDTDIAQILQRADKALYQAKESGKNQVIQK